MRRSGLGLSGATKLSLSFSGRKKATTGSSVDAGLAASVNHDNRPTVDRVDPIDMKVGDLALQFKDGGWTSTDTAGNSRTLMAPSARPDTSLADAAEIDRVKKENEALRGEVCLPRRTRLWHPARCADLGRVFRAEQPAKIQDRAACRDADSRQPRQRQAGGLEGGSRQRKGRGGKRAEKAGGREDWTNELTVEGSGT